MKVSKEFLHELMKSRDIRITRQREAILKILYDYDRPLTVNDIYSVLEREIPSLRLSTIYRNLNSFVKKELVRKIDLNINKKENSFELLKAEKHHHHLVCVRCNDIVPLDCPLEKYEEKVKKKTNYTILDHKVKIYGICPKCKD